MEDFEGWITTDEAQRLTGYTRAHIRYLAGHGLVKARKVGRDWVVSRESLLAHVEEMKRLGTAKHNPWREDLGEGKGRKER